MNRHVIKGRGENRGNYLCYARMAGLPPEAGYVWLPEQRKAARWPDPSRRGYETQVCAQHNGFFVKLVAPATLTRDVVSSLNAFINERATGAEQAVGCHWLDADLDAGGDNYCLVCAKKAVDDKYAADPARFVKLFGECEDAEARYREAIDGGEIDHSHTPYCATCGVRLRGLLSESGADDQIAELTGDCAPDGADVEGWAALDRAIVNLEDDDPRWRKIARVVEAARGQGSR